MTTLVAKNRQDGHGSLITAFHCLLSSVPFGGRGKSLSIGRQQGTRHLIAAWAGRLSCLLALLFCGVHGTPGWAQDAGERAQEQSPLVQWRGRTMGTTYMAKVFDPPAFDDDLSLEIDAELRRVNDQMSTYLESSEVSRFNASESTDWFPVSREVAEVVQYAQRVAEHTDGAFDVTVGPLVDAWSFGPEPRQDTLPSEAMIARLKQQVGYEKLDVRLDPPAIRKAIPELQIDLSAIAKGHGVDRIVGLLNRHGMNDVFVEIGGEVRTTGAKSDQPWVVGIQTPDELPGRAQIAHPLPSQSMATSGDYRNYFEVDGQRYSHTIDPRTGIPVDHQLASVSVIADTCMAADAWATAINVLGLEAGIAVAEAEELDVLLIQRQDQGYSATGLGTLAQYAQEISGGQGEGESVAAEDAASIWPVMLLTLAAFGIILAGMAIGVIFGRRAISGSCGGLNANQNADGSTSCSLCSNPSDGCKELREQMREGRDSRQRDEAEAGS